MAINYLPTLVGVNVFEQHNSNTFSVDESGLKATVVLRCAWTNRFAVMEDILINEGAYPYTTYDDMTARSASCVPDGARATTDGQGLQYIDALITVNYDTSKEKKDDDVISESLEPNLEFFNLPHENFRWNSATGDPVLAEESPGKLIVGFDYVQTRYNLNAIPGTYLSELGKVNSGTVTASYLGVTFAPETLLYANFSPNRKITSGAAAKWTLAATYSYRSSGWNKFWRAKDQAWSQMYIADGAVYKNFVAGTLPIV